MKMEKMRITIMTQTQHQAAMKHWVPLAPYLEGVSPPLQHQHSYKRKKTTRKNESNHAPNSYSINIEVNEEYIDIANKNNLQLFHLHRDENEDVV